MLGALNLDKTYQYLLIFLAFLLPLTVAGANAIIVLICLIWIFSGNYKFKYKQIVKSRVLLASIIFYLLHVFGLLWTEDIEWGFHILHKMWYFILFYPILFSIVQKEYIKSYIYAFLAAIFVTEIISFLVWFQFIEYFKNADVIDPTPFMSHISFNPILAFSIYLVSYTLFIKKELNKFQVFFYSIFLLMMTLTMFITGGRAGQVMYFLAITILIYQYFDTQKIKSILAIILIVPSIFIIAYHNVDHFNKRVNLTIDSALNLTTKPDSSLALRVTFNRNSFEIIKENLLFGAGTGDFNLEYNKVHLKNSPNQTSTTNPHNMYTLVLVELGLIGLFSFLSIFYYQIKFALNNENRFMRDVGFALPVFFLVIMLSDSYLLGHFTTLLFVFFSSFLHKDFEKI